MHIHVCLQLSRLSASIFALFASERLLSSVNKHVCLHAMISIAGIFTKFADESHFPKVWKHVCCKITRVFKRIITLVTFVNFFGSFLVFLCFVECYTGLSNVVCEMIWDQGFSFNWKQTFENCEVSEMKVRVFITTIITWTERLREEEQFGPCNARWVRRSISTSLVSPRNTMLHFSCKNWLYWVWNVLAWIIIVRLWESP